MKPTTCRSGALLGICGLLAGVTGGLLLSGWILDPHLKHFPTAQGILFLGGPLLGILGGVELFLALRGRRSPWPGIIAAGLSLFVVLYLILGIPLRAGLSRAGAHHLGIAALACALCILGALGTAFAVARARLRMFVASAAIVILALLAFALLRGPSQDYTDMSSMGARIRAEVNRALDAGDITRARNVAIASSVFAREMRCVQWNCLPSEADRDSLRRPSNIPVGLVRLDDYRKVMEAITLNPDSPAPGLSRRAYAALLATLLPQSDLTRLNQIRGKIGYWMDLQMAMDGEE